MHHPMNHSIQTADTINTQTQISPSHIATYDSGESHPNHSLNHSTSAHMQINRLTISDRQTGRHYLIDTGADVSVLPRPQSIAAGANCKPDPKEPIPNLYAANGTRVKTYGSARISLNIGIRRPRSQFHLRRRSAANHRIRFSAQVQFAGRYDK